MLGIADWDKGSATAGNRGYYLVGDGVLLNQVPEIDYCTASLVERKDSFMLTLRNGRR